MRTNIKIYNLTIITVIVSLLFCISACNNPGKENANRANLAKKTQQDSPVEVKKNTVMAKPSISRDRSGICMKGIIFPNVTSTTDTSEALKTLEFEFIQGKYPNFIKLIFSYHLNGQRANMPNAYLINLREVILKNWPNAHVFAGKNNVQFVLTPVKQYGSKKSLNPKKEAYRILNDLDHANPKWIITFAWSEGVGKYC